MSRVHRRRGGGDDHGGGGGGHGGGDERWMASYMDMVTVLMCLFIVLFAMSSVDQQKFFALKNSLATGFGVKATDKVDTASGIVVPPDEVKKDAEGFAGMSEAKLEIANLTGLQNAIGGDLQAKDLQSDVQFAFDERGLIIRLVGNQTFFDSNRAELSPMASQVLDTIGSRLAPTSYDISVEGHADVRQPGAPYPTNWELSSARATSVLRRLVETSHVTANHIGSVGYGDSRPLVTGTTDADLASNRRVDIVVLSASPDAVRALFGNVLAEQGKSIEGAPGETPVAANIPTAPSTAEAGASDAATGDASKTDATKTEKTSKTSTGTSGGKTDSSHGSSAGEGHH